MASADGSPTDSGVHVLSCGHEPCQPFLRQVLSALRQKDIRCVEDYKPGGLYKDCFRQAFHQTKCSVLHVCPSTLQQVELLESLLEAEAEKAWFVRLQAPTSTETDPPLLLKFNVKDLTTPEKISKFLEDLIRHAGGNTTENPPQSDPSKPDPPKQPPPSSRRRIPPSERQLPPRPDTGEEIQGQETSRVSELQPVAMVLRPGTPLPPFVHQAFFALDSPQGSSNAVETSTAASTQRDLPVKDHPYYTHVLLPGLYEKEDLVALTHFACSPLLHLRLEALHLILRLLLEKLPKFKIQTFIDAEKHLFISLEKHFSGKLTSKQEEDYVSKCLDSAELLSTVYLVLVAGRVLRGKPSESAVFCQKIAQRPFFTTKKQSPISKLTQHLNLRSDTVPAWYRAVEMCIMAWSSQTNCEKVNRLAAKTVRCPSSEEAKWERLSPEASVFRFPLLVECLVKSLQESKPVFLDFMSNYKRKATKPREPSISLQRLITSLLILGINTFLQLRSENLSSSEDFQPVCRQAMESLHKVMCYLDKENHFKCSFLLTPMLFSMNKAIRQGTGNLLRQQFFYHEYMWEMLMLEAILILWPMLHVSEIDPKSKTNIHHSWAVFKATFNGHRVQTHLHRSTGTYHLSHNKTVSNRVLQQDPYFLELSFLQELKHENVLRLVAFHNVCCPQFYITEDYLTKTLQAALVNRARNGHHYSFKQLLMFLLEALKGIQYCHEKNIVHRDLTAANIFMTADNKVKLAGFKHALKRSGKEVIKDFNLSFIATRWSAPESYNCCFSLASDIWMVGHLMYEVLTHGRKPYADISKPDEELMPLVVKGKVRLCEERCFPKSIQILIYQLTEIREVHRKISAKKVAARLQYFMSSREYSEDYCQYFPDLHLDSQIATKHEKGPVESLKDDFHSSAEEDSDDGCEIYTKIPEPKKGPLKFTETCPESFGGDEWDMLTQENLPSITKLIWRPRKSKGQLVLPFMIPSSSGLCSLKDAVKGNVFGNKVDPYIECLKELATSMAYLHSRRIILCDFSADTVQVEELADGSKSFQVWITSLTRIKVLPEDNEWKQHIDLPRPQAEDQIRRAAPEVLQYGQYSPASDVYCFGRLIWWVFNALDLIAQESAYTDGDLKPLKKVPLEDVYNDAVSCQGPPIPKCCPRHLSKLIEDCLQPSKQDRPRMDRVRRYLILDGSHNNKMELYEGGYDPVIGNPSEATSTSPDYDDEPPYFDLPDAESLSGIANPSNPSETDQEDDPYSEISDMVSCSTDSSSIGDMVNPSEVTDTEDDVFSVTSSKAYDDIEEASITSTDQGDEVLSVDSSGNYDNIEDDVSTGSSSISVSTANPSEGASEVYEAMSKVSNTSSEGYEVYELETFAQKRVSKLTMSTPLVTPATVVTEESSYGNIPERRCEEAEVAPPGTSKAAKGPADRVGVVAGKDQSEESEEKQVYGNVAVTECSAGAERTDSSLASQHADKNTSTAWCDEPKMGDVKMVSEKQDKKPATIIPPPLPPRNNEN